MTTASVSAPATASVPRIRALETAIAGRVAERGVRSLDNGTVLTRIVIPAPDQFSHPQTVEVRSERRFAQPGQDVTIVARIGSYRRTFRLRDGTQGDAIEHNLYLVE